jgi:hypothetical protein
MCEPRIVSREEFQLKRSRYSAEEVFAWLQRVCGHKGTMCLLAAALAMGIRIALLPRMPIPQPYVPDEFSYLLGAETFASGHISNPPHPMWVHFETFHELMRPTYGSKFPPGQALFLALGWILLGHPWFGVWISFGLFCACLCWMLQNWVPPVYAVLGTAITVAQISLFGYWMNSYMGGAVAASAGCIVLGILPRLARRVKPREIVVVSLGLVLLANTRPYENLVMSTAALVVLLYWRIRRRRGLRELVALRCLIPLILVCGPGLLLTGYYNYRITGHPFVMPYQLYSQQYSIAPPWIIMRERKPPVYRHTVIEKYWDGPDLQNYRKERSNLLFNLTSLKYPIGFYFSFLYLFPIAIGFLLSGSYKVRAAASISFCLWGALLIVNGKFPHYIAGGVGLFAVLAAYGFRLLRVTSKKLGPALVLILAVLISIQLVVRQTVERTFSWETDRKYFSATRGTAAQACLKKGGKHLIFVRYSGDHDVNHEYVYNSPDIDGSAIVWARDMGDAINQELIDFYQGSRQVWLWDPDIEPARLIPYESGGLRSNPSPTKFSARTGLEPATARTYETSFSAAENPIGEGGQWINGGSCENLTLCPGLHWNNVGTTTGFAFGTESGAGGYTDSTALLTGSWGPSQKVWAKVRILRQDTASNEELELRLRSTLTAYSSTGYEIEYSDKQDKPYIGITRWNGGLEDFTGLGLLTKDCGGDKHPCFVKDGDVVMATTVDNVITVYLNGMKVVEVKDSMFPTGQPGVGFNFYLGEGHGANTNFGFSAFGASDQLP